MTTNPYTAPAAPVADPVAAAPGNFVPGGRGVRAGRGGSWVAEGWRLYKAQPLMWILVSFLLLLILGVLNVIPLVGPIANSILWPVFNAGLMLGCQAIAQGEGLGAGHLFAGFRERLGTLAGIGATTLGISLLIVLVVVFMGFGAGAFGGLRPGSQEAALTGALAGLVVLALMLPLFMAIWFAPALAVFNERGVLESLKESFTGCLRNILPFLIYGLVGLVFSALVMVPIFVGVGGLSTGVLSRGVGIPLIAVPILVGWLVFTPVFLASIYASYRDIYFRP